METQRKQSQLYWHIQAWIFVLLIPISGFAQSFLKSGYEPVLGKNFFVLTDTTFSSQEIAKVRFEISANNGDFEAAEEYGGVDIAVYEVAQPVNFLKSQKNLHRVNTKYNYEPTGEVANAISYVWDHFYKTSRMMWQRILSTEAREKATAANAKFKQLPPDSYRTKYKTYKQFKPLKGFKLIDEFRYPITKAEAIVPPQVSLPGSSSTFSPPSKGNVYIPLGKLKGGLYLVEAMFGDHRANTLVFVSDSVLVTKMSSNQIFVWSADKFKGTPVPDMKVLVTDGIGTLHENETNKEGVVTFKGKAPEQSYFIGTDENGGVVISENFYHDSEIYSNKIFAFTDRPLYRPGDQVKMKVIARKFTDSSKSEWIKATPFDCVVIDPSGTILLKEKLTVNGEFGGETNFRLPSYALPGGYTVLLKNKNDTFASEFRVNRYTKPHFNVDVLVTPVKPKLNQELKATIQLTFANGKPLPAGEVNVVVRRQRLTVLEGETDMQSLFPVEVSDTTLKIDADGKATLDLPKVKEPSKYILYVKAKDSSSLTVNATNEFFIESANDSYSIEGAQYFSQKDEEVSFELKKTTTTSSKEPKLKWEAIRLEDRSKLKGEIKDKKFSVKFTEGGTYQIRVYSDNGDLLGGRSHVVAGEKLKTMSGHISMTLDQESYAPGEKAKVLVSFSEPVTEALISIERDKVERFALSGSDDWAKIDKSNPKLWTIEFPIDDSMSPNVTFSVLYVKDGKLVFNNKGLQIKRPEIKLAFTLDKKSYAPGDTVKLDLYASLGNTPVTTNVTLGVVDEMIYTLQPEIAPNILDFFYHRRRNQVKTSSSLNFFTYDSSVSATGKSSSSSSYGDRPLKLKDRPRREEIDTAYWGPSLKTDKNGKLSIQFKLPDSVTRWRVTARAIASTGVVGQNITQFNSDKDVYLKWGGLSELRKNDEIETSIIGFNLTSSPLEGNLVTTTNGKSDSQDVTLGTGANYVPVKFKAESTQDLNLKFKGDKKAKDNLNKLITVAPVNWESSRDIQVTLKNGTNNLSVPKNSFHYQLVSQLELTDKFLNTAKGLIEYPYGCVEQTASKLIPLTMAYGILKNIQGANTHDIKNQIISARERLIRMANEDGLFGWYGDMGNESFMTVYAYLADFYAANELGIHLPSNHFAKMGKAYRDVPTENILRNALMIWMMAQSGQPVQTLMSGVWTKLKASKIDRKVETYDDNNLVMSPYYSQSHQGLATVILAISIEEAQKHKLSVQKENAAEIPAAAKSYVADFEKSNSILLKSAALRLTASSLPKEALMEKAEDIFYSTASHYATADRSLALILLHHSIKYEKRAGDYELKGNWRKILSPLGLNVWEYTGKPGETLTVDVSKLPKEAGDFKLIYSSYETDKHELPVSIGHNYYELQTDKDGNYEGTLVKNNQFSGDKFYVSEVTLESQGAYDFGLLEVPMVPGSMIEKGFEDSSISIIKGKGKETINLSRTPEVTNLSYAVPVRSFSKSKNVYYHIVRFGAKGTFNLPQARFFEMYRSFRKAYAQKNSPVTQVVNVR